MNKKKLYKILDSWVGLVLFVLSGLLILYFFVGSKDVAHYFLVIVGVPLLYYFKKQDVIPYIYGGIVFAFGAHLFLGLILSTDLPVVSVLTSSMQHDNVEITHYQWLEKNLGYNRSYIDSWPVANGFAIGDMPIVQGANNPADYSVGDVIVYSVPNERIPVIHRIIKINADGTYQTKGDNNPGQLPYETSVKKEQIYGKVIFIIPKLGYFKVLVTRIFGVF